MASIPVVRSTIGPAGRRAAGSRPGPRPTRPAAADRPGPDAAGREGIAPGTAPHMPPRSGVASAGRGTSPNRKGLADEGAFDDHGVEFPDRFRYGSRLDDNGGSTFQGA